MKEIYVVPEIEFIEIELDVLTMNSCPADLTGNGCNADLACTTQCGIF